TVGLQHRDGELAHHIFVLDDENGFAPSARLHPVDGWFFLCPLDLRRGRQEHMESSAHAHSAFEFEPTLMLLDDARDCRQAETGALAHLLRGEKRLENPRPNLRRDAATGILDGKTDEISR